MTETIKYKGRELRLEAEYEGKESAERVVFNNNGRPGRIFMFKELNPMPALSINDWLLFDYDQGLRVYDGRMCPVLQNITEIRKADGTVWRRS